MILVVLAAVGVPLWLIAGMLGLTLRSRRQFRRRQGVFPCRLREAASAEAQSDGRWPKRYAYWVHDVLLVHRGPALLRYEALPVSGISGPAEATVAKGLGERPVRLGLRLDDGRLIDLAARNDDAVSAAGPFVTAPSGGSPR